MSPALAGELSVPPAPRTRRPRRITAWRATWYVGGSALALMFVMPIVFAILGAVETPEQAAQAPLHLLPHLTLANFGSLHLAGISVWGYLRNSLIVAVGSVVLTTALASLAGYGFALYEFRGKNWLFFLSLAGLMVPFQVVVIPLFLILRFFSLTNSLVGLTLAYTTFQLPFGIFVMRNAFEQVPRSLVEAAALDGAHSLARLRHLLMPLALPSVVTVALFSFFAAWNEFFAALILLEDQSKYTLPLMLLNLVEGNYGTINWGQLESGVVVTMVPCVVLFLLLQRFYVQGMLEGSVRG